MIIDNCKAHLHVKNLGWVELMFLPPNTTSVTQPMDQGIIRSLKAKYRSLAVKKVISALEEKKGAAEVFCSLRNVYAAKGMG